MQIGTVEGSHHVSLLPGELYAAKGYVTIGTLLGSCVAACLYEPYAQVIGMNHFLLSNRRYSKELPICRSEAGRYGIHAMELLINEMLKQGARRDRIQAKAFGGASVYLTPSSAKDNFFCVGDINARFIREFLKTEGIPLIAEDLGGEQARVIRFHSDDYSVHVRKVVKTAQPELVRVERQLWMREIEMHEKTNTDADVWG